MGRHQPPFFVPIDSKSFRSRVSAIRSQVQVFSTRFGFRIIPAPELPHLNSRTRHPTAETWDPRNASPRPTIRSLVSL